MKTRYFKAPGCVPNPSEAYRQNVLADHFHRHDIDVELSDGTLVKTGHLHADGRRIEYKSIYPSDTPWSHAYITQFSYTAEDGSTGIVEVEPRNPHPLEQGYADTRFGYVTKINGKRWGVMVHINVHSGVMRIIPDHGSPITGALIQFI